MEEYDLRDVSYEKLNRGYENQWELMDDLFAWLDLRIYFFYEHHQWLGPKNDMRNMMGLVVSREEFEHNLVKAAQLGLDTVLTSGQAADCWTGRSYLGALLEEGQPLSIMAGGGVQADVIRRLRAQYPLDTFHMSGKITQPSGMTFRREGVPMGLPGLDEFTIWQTSEAQVRAAAAALREEILC